MAHELNTPLAVLNGSVEKLIETAAFFAKTAAMGRPAASGVAMMGGSGGGLIAAKYRDKRADRAIVLTGLATSSIPEFVTAAVLVSVFCVHWKLGKAFANPPDGTSFVVQLRYLLTPAIAMAITYFGYLARMTRAGVISAQHSDYARTATMKGLSKGQVMRRHILRNALAPTLTVISVQIGYLFGGIIGVERVFNYPGLGSTMLNAAKARDVPLLQGSVLVVAIIYMISTLLADLLIAILLTLALLHSLLVSPLLVFPLTHLITSPFKTLLRYLVQLLSLVSLPSQTQLLLPLPITVLLS